ncbi:MAG: AbrB/MazE/SpoVT family DNA-binding domain-containing protein [Promethearchaeia archaeon]
MKEARIITIDSRGRIVIPKIVRESLGLEANSQLYLVADSESKTITITPMGLNIKDPYKFKIVMADAPGSLAKLALTFGNLGISIVYGQAMTLIKGKTALWTLIAPKPENISLEELKERLMNEGNALEVEYSPLE